MESESSPQSPGDGAPIFEGFRRGYDPEHVDRFVADQQRRLDETLGRATEAERRLAAAVGQLRELHRRVATLEAEGRSPQVPTQPLDTLGERVQRILQEAWEGAHAVRQSAEEEAAEIRQRTLREAEEVVGAARRKAKTIEDEIERRRRAYLGRVEEERAKAVAQISYLHEQRQSVVGELIRMKDAIESTVGKVGTSHAPAEESANRAAPTRHIRPTDTVAPSPKLADQPARAEERVRPHRPRTVRDVAPRTMPVVHLGTNEPESLPDASELVRNHRAAIEEKQRSATATVRSIRAEDQAAPTVFDFEQEQPS